jgi:very-short-patch-repair endonuclease
MNHGSNKTGCLGMLLGWLASPPSRGAGAPVHYPYGKRDFLSAAELTFFRVLKNQLPPEWHLVAKVNLADLFFVRQPHRNRAARNRIDRKHVDFVICEAATMRPLLAVELDDASHDRADRVARDAFVDRVFEAAGLPILHVRFAWAYQPEVLMHAIRQKLGLVPPVPPPLPSVEPPPLPVVTAEPARPVTVRDFYPE